MSITTDRTEDDDTELAGPRVTGEYLDRLMDVRKQALRIVKRYESGEWMDRRDVFNMVFRAHAAWAHLVQFLAAELGIESRVVGLGNPDWPDLTQPSGEPLTLEEIRALDREEDDFITGVYTSVLETLKARGIDTEDDDVQWSVEDLADELWFKQAD